MLQLIRWKKPSPEVDQKAFQKEFFANPLHQWIHEDRYLKRSILEFLESFKPQDLRLLMKGDKKLILTPASGLYSCAFNATEKFDFIIVFPDLLKILRSASPDRGIAILLHEAGHLILKHSARDLDPLEAQLEADAFCAQRGHALALYDFLNECPWSEEIDLRKRYIQTKLV